VTVGCAAPRRSRGSRESQAGVPTSLAMTTRGNRGHSGRILKPASDLSEAGLGFTAILPVITSGIAIGYRFAPKGPFQ
jgi:hypothetical protein